MATIAVNDVVIRGVSTCVPARTVGMEEIATDEEAVRIINSAGTLSRHIVDEKTCTSDLCHQAASELLAELGWEPSSIDLLVMVTHTPDHIMPSTACILQDRLGLPNTCAAFDVSLGCSGFVYGLCLASRMMGKGGLARALVLVGETPSKACDPSDRATTLIFGDAGSAAALEVSDSPVPSSYVLHSDGAGKKDFVINAGAFRQRFSEDKREYFMRMNGAGIFTFTLKRVPALVRDALEFAGLTPDEVDYFVFHQANRFILEHLRKKMKLDKAKVPVNIERFANTAGTSVPLCLTQGGLELAADRPLQLLLLGFGVGLSWGAAAVQLVPGVVLCHSEL